MPVVNALWPRVGLQLDPLFATATRGVLQQRHGFQRFRANLVSILEAGGITLQLSLQPLQIPDANVVDYIVGFLWRHPEARQHLAPYCERRLEGLAHFHGSACPQLK